MTMEDWAKRIDLILEVGGDNVLDNAGHITASLLNILLKQSSRSIV